MVKFNSQEIEVSRTLISGFYYAFIGDRCYYVGLPDRRVGYNAKTGAGADRVYSLKDGKRKDAILQAVDQFINSTDEN